MCILPDNARLGSTINPAVQNCTADFDLRNIHIFNETKPTVHIRKICTSVQTGGNMQEEVEYGLVSLNNI